MTRLLPLLLVLLAPPARPSSGADGVRADVRADVLAAAEAFLSERYPADAHRLEVRVLRLSVDEAADGPFELAWPPAPELPRAHTQVRLQAGGAVGGRDAGWALLYVAHHDSVAVPAATLEADALVGPADLDFAWIETTRFRGEPLRPADLRALQDAGGAFAARALRAGRALVRGDLRPPNAADTGASVRMRYERGRVVLTLTTQAREPGAVGDVVRLYSPDTQATYRARLTGDGEALWIETL